MVVRGPKRGASRHLTKAGRRTVVLALLALSALLTIAGVRASGHPRGEPLVTAVVGASQARLMPGGGLGGPTTGQPRATTARKGNRKKPVTHTHPTVLHLEAAHAKVFDVRKLRGAVVKRERPERRAPGFEPQEEDAAATVPARAPSPYSVLHPSGVAPSGLAAPVPAPDSNFAGLDFATWGVGHPPDTNGDVGPTYYIQTINTSIGIYDKATGTRVAAFTFDAFMSQGNFGNLCDTDNFGDPVVLYDSFEDRWFLSDFAFQLDASGNVNPQHVFECFAVSKTGDPVSGGWNFYSIEAPGGLADYPKFGVWPDGIYMSANMFGYSSSGSFLGTHVWVLNKLQMYAGDQSPQVVDFTGPSDDFTLLPANARLQAGTPPGGRPEFFVSTEQFLNALSIYQLHVELLAERDPG
jgi:hypothetical protein